jgi:endonuclease-3
MIEPASTRTRMGARATTTKVKGKRVRGRRARPDPARAWAKRLQRTRPGLVDFVLDTLVAAYAIGPWVRVHDPTSELVLTILSQNSSDVNAEHAFESLRRRYPGGAQEGRIDELANRPGWGGSGLAQADPPDWIAVESAPLDELIDVIRSGGLAPQKAPRIQASLRRVREERGDHDLGFLGEMAPLEARAWLTSIDGIGKKTASVVLLFAFGMDLMPVDRHVERVSKRIGLIPPKLTAEDAHDHYLAMLDPGRAYPLHVGLITHGRRICHARVPECDRCPIAPRCRYVDRRAP